MFTPLRGIESRNASVPSACRKLVTLYKSHHEPSGCGLSHPGRQRKLSAGSGPPGQVQSPWPWWKRNASLLWPFSPPFPPQPIFAQNTVLEMLLSPSAPTGRSQRIASTPGATPISKPSGLSRRGSAPPAASPKTAPTAWRRVRSHASVVLDAAAAAAGARPVSSRRRAPRRRSARLRMGEPGGNPGGGG